MNDKVIEMLLNAQIEMRVQLELIENALASASTPRIDTKPLKHDNHRRLLQTDFAKIGGRDFTPAPTDAFKSSAFADRWSPSGETRAIYAGACSGLSDLSKTFHAPIYKVSTCDSRRMWARMHENRIVDYGAVHYDGTKYVRGLGWKNWFLSYLRSRHLPSPMSPVQCTSHAILVPLPEGLSRDMFDAAFDAQTRLGALDRFTMSEEGRNHCATLGFSPALGQRLTSYPGGDSHRLSPANEICLFSCYYSGPDRAIAIAEAIILRHLKLID